MNFKKLCLYSFCLFSFSPLAFAKKDTTVQRTPPVPSELNSNSKDSSVSSPVSSGKEAPLGSPTRAIQDLEKRMDGYKTGPNLSPEDLAFNAQLKREVLNGTFDLRELCRLALDKHWEQRTAEEQNAFVGLMTQLLEKQAVFSKEQSKTQGKKYFIRFMGEEILGSQKERVLTKTLIQIPKENLKVSIQYKMVKTPSGWKIFDVIVDDASLVENYKYQFNTIITKQGYPELINRMKKKMSQIGSKKSE